MAKQKVTITPKGKAARAPEGAEKGRVAITPKGKNASGKTGVTITAKGKPKSTGASGTGKASGANKVTITPRGKNAPGSPGTALATSPSSVPARQPSPIVSLLDFPPGLADGVRDVFMAGLGALATLEDEAQSFFSSLVKRGERWEAEARGVRPDAEPDQAAELAERLGQQLRTAVRDAVEASTKDRASHADLAALREDVAALGVKLDALAARVSVPAEAPRAEPASTEATPEPTPKKADPAKAEPTGDPTVLEVRAAEEGGWVVLKSGAPEQTHATKVAATAAARRLGDALAPAEIVLYKQDGTEQRRITIDAS